MNEATLVVSRTLPADVGQRQVYVELDGELIETLLNGETITLTIAAGHLRLRFDNTLHKKTVEFTLTPAQVGRVGADGRRLVEAGEVELTVAGMPRTFQLVGPTRTLD